MATATGSRSPFLCHADVCVCVRGSALAQWSCQYKVVCHAVSPRGCASANVALTPSVIRRRGQCEPASCTKHTHTHKTRTYSLPLSPSLFLSLSLSLSGAGHGPGGGAAPRAAPTRARPRRGTQGSQQRPARDTGRRHRPPPDRVACLPGRAARAACTRKRTG